ncbi:hypothetical protein EB118_05360 [bacterium]|nr:hypothetical protein [bacterium]NDC93764.1 hypothetical protein [bacterium]NDD83097.1 hypothetical protein [bacterium]NDG29512.1 hypothetical protein [bacterium]
MELLLKKALYVAILVAIVYLLKPGLAFKPNGQHREYGVGVDSQGYKKSVYTMFTFVVVIVVLVNKYIQ